MDTRFLLYSGAMLALALLSFVVGVNLYGTLLAVVGPQGSLVMTSPSDLWWAMGRLGAVLALPALCAWVGALVSRWRAGQLPQGVTLLLLYGMPLLAVVCGVVGRAVAMRLMLPVMQTQLQGFQPTLSLEGLALGSWGLRLGLVAGMANIAWMLLRRKSPYPLSPAQHTQEGAR